MTLGEVVEVQPAFQSGTRIYLDFGPSGVVPVGKKQADAVRGSDSVADHHD